MRILIIVEHASARFGGEAILPIHYFARLRARGVDVRLVVHERTRPELLERFPNDADRIHFLPNTRLHRLIDRVSVRLSGPVRHFTAGWLSRLLTQLAARRLARRLVRRHRIDVVHQPIPVSPKETSLLYGLGAAVVIGPMNGGMTYPPNIAPPGRGGTRFVRLARPVSGMLHRLIPGKLRADVLLVANERTRRALPAGCRGRVLTVVENGVDLALWTPREPSADNGPVRFLFSGRLADWKAVDLLVEAFADSSRRAPMTLEIVGDGAMRPSLEAQVRRLGLDGLVHFAGWLDQAECARRLRSADVLVLPSLHECGGAVVLEAMATGLPVIATAWGGPKDYLDESCGILVEPESRERLLRGLAEAMTRLALDPALRERLGRAGRARVVEQFDWERKIDRILEIYAIARDDRLNRRGLSQSRRCGV